MNLPNKSLEQDEHWKTQEWLRCSLSPIYFLQTYGKIKDEERGIITFEPWGYLATLLEILLKERQVIILKARQLGISTLVSGYCLWKALFYEGSTVYLLSKGEKEASKLIDKCKVLWEYLPNFLRLPVGKWQESALSFPALHSSIDALPSTEDAGRMTGATIVVCDEWARHPYAEQNYLAIRPTLGDAGQFVGLSTPSEDSGTFFDLMFNKTIEGETGFYRHFLPWDKRPGRDTDWYEREKKNYIGLNFEREYPATEDEALRPLDITRFFDNKALAEMESDCIEPRETKLDGIVKIYKKPVPGRIYVAAIDPSDGQYDPAAGIIEDWRTSEQVVDVHGKLRTDELAVIWDGLIREYNNALHGEEGNASAGGAFIAKLKELDTPNPYYYKKDKWGWWTNEYTRSTMLLEHANAIANGEKIIHNKAILDEHRAFIVPEGKKPQARPGKHDDYVICYAILGQMRKHIKPHTVGFKSWTRKETTY